MTSVHLVTLGCARNEVDSEELAARLAAGGFRLVDDPERAQAVVVNTCGFIEQAKKDSIDTLLDAADLKGSGATQAVVAVGCLAERYGRDLAEQLPEADAVLGFDDYGEIAARLNAILHGDRHEAHVPSDRRTLLPLSPAARPAAASAIAVPGHADAVPAGQDQPGAAPSTGPRPMRQRLSDSPSAPLKIASGCDRRCAFCAIPRFRGSYLSRPQSEVVAEARWLATQGVRELFLVSENTSSYGKDLGDARALENLLAELSSVEGIDWVRVSYLQPAELRPSLIEAIATTEKVVPYFDLSFQHAAPDVLRRMRRFGDPDSFLALIDSIRRLSPQAGLRTNVIAGFPGETTHDVTVLADFLRAARLDVVGVFGYSDEEDTEAAGLDGQLDADEIEARRGELADLAAALCEERAEDRVGERSVVLIEEVEAGAAIGRALHQGPEVDGTTTVQEPGLTVGSLIEVEFSAASGVDLVGEPKGAGG